MGFEFLKKPKAKRTHLDEEGNPRTKQCTRYRVWPAPGAGQTPSGRLGCNCTVSTSVSWNHAPRIASLNGSRLALAKETVYVRFGRWKWRSSHILVCEKSRCRATGAVTAHIHCHSPSLPGPWPPLLLLSPPLASLNPGEILTPGKQKDVQEEKSNHDI